MDDELAARRASRDMHPSSRAVADKLAAVMEADQGGMVSTLMALVARLVGCAATEHLDDVQDALRQAMDELEAKGLVP